MRGGQGPGQWPRGEDRRHRHDRPIVNRADLARDRSEQRPERFAVGEKVDAKVMQLDTKARKINVSIKALEIADEKAAVAQYGSSDSGASLGDILGARDEGKKDAESQGNASALHGRSERAAGDR